MNTTFITLIASIIVGLGLLVGGVYITIDNLIHPQGYLFEGIVLGGLGLMIILMFIISTAIGKTILTFGEIMQNQANLQNQVREMNAQAHAQSGRQINVRDIFKSILQNPSGEGKGFIDLSNQNEDDYVDAIKKMANLNPEDNLEGLGIDELEKELAKAIKSDDYEKAEKINKAIKHLKNLGDNEELGEEPEENK